MNQRLFTKTRRLPPVTAVAAYGASVQAQGLSNLNTVMQNILTALQGISAATVSIAIMWVGYKMVFQHARWSEVANIVIGALFIGGASAIASWLLG